MVFVTLLVSATKVAGVLATITIAANAFSYSRFRRRNLRRFRSPIDESADCLADFTADEDENSEFFFGLATAPAHVEDQLNDAWLQFATEQPCDRADSQSEKPLADAVMGSVAADGGAQGASTGSKKEKKKKRLELSMKAMIKGLEDYYSEDKEEELAADKICHHNVAAWHNTPHPEERLKFWSDPDTELKLARETGVTVFRMGIDWCRIMPKEPINGLKQAVNFTALARYKWIISRVRSYGMKVMVTLFHHSLPPWAGEYGGWKMEKTVDYFMDFTKLVVDSVSDMVEYWVTFNEPHVFCMLTYCSGTWPGSKPDFLEVATSALPMGVLNQSLHWMAVAHSKAYDYIHEKTGSLGKAMVGVAHHVSFMRPYGLFDLGAVTLANALTVYPFLDSIADKMDYVGLNYYGQEVVSGPGLKLVETDEYSESGRGVYPDGLFRVLMQFHERYKHLNAPFIIAENGISDATDVIRRPYLIEHLLATYAAMLKGVPVIGYLFWTISDNWEWADGYGPKFGLVAVDRANNLARQPRPSYDLFSKIVKSGKISHQDRARAWRDLQRASKEGKVRPFYRAVDKNGLMYAGGLDEPVWRPYVERDWRFGHYEMEGLQDPLSRLGRAILLWPLFVSRSKRRVQIVDVDEEDERLLLYSSASV